MNLNNPYTLNRYIFRFFPQLPKDSFYITKTSKRLRLFIATKEGKLIHDIVYRKSYKILNSSPKELDELTNNIQKLVEKAGYY